MAEVIQEKKLSEYTEELPTPYNWSEVVLYGVEKGESVKVPFIMLNAATLGFPVIKVVTASSIRYNLSNLNTESLPPNSIVIVTDFSSTTSLQYKYNGITKTLYGSPDFDVPFRYVGSAGFKPIMFPTIIN